MLLMGLFLMGLFVSSLIWKPTEATIWFILCIFTQIESFGFCLFYKQTEFYTHLLAKIGPESPTVSYPLLTSVEFLAPSLFQILVTHCMVSLF